jgi:hypothetical protein
MSAEDEKGEEKRGAFRRFYYRGHEVPTLLDFSEERMNALFHARARRRLKRRGMPLHLLKRLQNAVRVFVWCLCGDEI